MPAWDQQKTQVRDFYLKNETKLAVGFFVGGFLFDVLTLSRVDDWFAVGQQIVYLAIVGMILTAEVFERQDVFKIQKMTSVWAYRSLIVHFLMGSLLSIYSLFFLKSASALSSIFFVVLIVTVMILNELPRFQKSEMNLKWALWVLCLYCFFSMLVPTLLGFVGWVPFILATALTIATLYCGYVFLRKKMPAEKMVSQSLFYPSLGVVAVFVVFYLVGWIPPVPLAVQRTGIYHALEKREGQFVLTHENSWWRVWNSGDQTFRAAPGDEIVFYAEVFSPARFRDQVMIRWLFDDPKQGWVTSDVIPMTIQGGREQGFRGYALKKNYQPGRWRVQVETTDSREIGRISLVVEPYDGDPALREWKQEIR